MLRHSFALAFLVGALLAPVAEARPHDPRQPCGAPHFLPNALRKPRAVVPREATETRQLRDSFGDFPNLVTSAHFALKWGSASDLSVEDGSKMLDALEASYAVQVEEMAHRTPTGADSFLLNVYVGSSGDGAPSAFAAAYVDVDDEGFEYIVVSPETIESYRPGGDSSYPDAVLAHEFYHVLQVSSGAYFGDDVYWYWEATADWIAEEVFPGNVNNDALAPGYLMYPHVSLTFADFADEGTLLELHHYGAQVFARYLSDVVADSSLIRDSWVNGGPLDDPLEVLDGLLAARGASITEVFGEFAARAAVLDLPHQEMLALWVDSFIPFYPGEDFRVADTAALLRLGGLVEPPAATLPERLAFNAIEIPPVAGPVFVSFEGAATGTRGSTADFRVTLVRQEGGRLQYDALALEGLRGELRADFSGQEEQAFLVVAAVPQESRSGEVFPYQYRVSQGLTAFTGGGCATSPGSSGGLGGLLLLAGLAWLRRRA